MPSLGDASCSSHFWGGRVINRYHSYLRQAKRFINENKICSRFNVKYQKLNAENCSY